MVEDIAKILRDMKEIFEFEVLDKLKLAAFYMNKHSNCSLATAVPFFFKYEDPEARKERRRLEKAKRAEQKKIRGALDN